ncbi:MAG: hypothetical protein WCP70_04265 [Methanothrix sp.]
MPNPQIEALDAEISGLEKQISDNMNMDEMIRIQERVISLKMKKQRLLSVDAMTAPANLREQIEAIDEQIATTEQAVHEATTRLTNPDPLYQRLTSLKVRKSDLLAKSPIEVSL